MTWWPERIAVFDFEYETDNNGLPVPVCVVATLLESDSAGTLRGSGDQTRCGWGEMRRLKSPPWDIGPGTVSLAFSGHGDLHCIDRLGWQRPLRYVDLMIELRNLYNGPCKKAFRQGLYDFLDRWGIPRPPDSYKSDLRDLILEGRSAERKQEVLEYCAMDVDLTVKLLHQVFRSIDWPRAVGHRGPFLQATSLAESRGLPVDVELLQALERYWPHIAGKAKFWVNQAFGTEIYRSTGEFSKPTMEQWLHARGYLRSWPRTDRTGSIRLDKETLKPMSKIIPQIAVLYDAMRVIDQGADGIRFDVGIDGRCRTWPNPFGAVTGRNAPREVSGGGSGRGPFLFGGARWVRSLLKPAPGKAISYIDYVSQEIHVGASLSGDENLTECYQSDDPYIAFARLAGAVPPNATKASHPKERAIFKTVLLGLAYGMGSETLAGRLSITVREADTLIRLHHKVFPKFWAWSESVSLNARRAGYIKNLYGWRMLVNFKTSKTSLLNWPVQAGAAAMLQTAMPMVERAGVKVLASIHDALLVESDIDEIDADVAKACAAMESASRIATGSALTCRTDPKIVRYPDRYMDENGEEMFDLIVAEIGKLEAAERGAMTGNAEVVCRY